jgi:hypothetical protein
MRKAIPAPARPSQPAVGYSLLGGRFSRAQRSAGLTGLAVGLALSFLYVHYLQSDDVSPDSLYGLGFAIGGTALLIVVGFGYVLRKRLRHHWAGRLHTSLAWHMVGGVLGLALIFMHAAGNFNPRSGTYALYGLIAVVVSGIVGRLLDRVCPQLATSAALATLGADGEERLDGLELRLESLPRHPRLTRLRVPAGPASGVQAAPWDLAYHDLNPATRDVPMLLATSAHTPHETRAAGARRARGARKRVGAYTVQREIRHEATALQHALGSEQFFLQLVRIWRRLHVLLTLVALGLVIWHLVYAATLVVGQWHR